MKCFELFGEFIEFNKLTNTSEVYNSEADYKKNADIRKQLTDILAPKPKVCLVQTLIEKTKNIKIVPPKEFIGWKLSWAACAGLRLSTCERSVTGTLFRNKVPSDVGEGNDNME